MGAYRHTYVGIYLEVPHTKVETTVKFYKHPTSGKNMKSRFDQDTGVEGIENERINIHYEQASPYIVDKEGFIEDMFSSPAYQAGDYSGGKNKYTTFLLNENDIELGELENLDLSDINIQEKIKDFKEDYKKYLDYYIELYGEVNIYYGIVNYAH